MKLELVREVSNDYTRLRGRLLRHFVQNLVAPLCLHVQGSMYRLCFEGEENVYSERNMWVLDSYK